MGIAIERSEKFAGVNKALKKHGLAIKRDHDGKRWGWFVIRGKERLKKVPALLLQLHDKDRLVDLAQRFAAPVYKPPVHRDVRGLAVEIGDVVAMGLDNGSTLFYGTVTALSEYVWIKDLKDGGRHRRVARRVAILEKAK